MKVNGLFLNLKMCRRIYMVYNERLYLKGDLKMNFGQKVIYTVGVVVVANIAAAAVDLGIDKIQKKILEKRSNKKK